MKKYLNTLYVTTQGAYLSKEGESVVVSVERDVKLRVPIHTLGSVVCFGNVLCSPFLLHHCGENNVAVSFLSEQGRFLARVEGPISGNVLLRREQYRWADDDAKSKNMAAAVVVGKTFNARTVLQRALRDHGDDDSIKAPIERVVRRLEWVMDGVKDVAMLDSVRGLEGEASREYFGVFDHLITSQKEDFFFRERSRRPPLDNMNCLLSFIYTLLMNDVRGALEGVGLDPQVGFLHRDRSGRASLALDMMEEFRPAFADRLALSLVNLRQLQAKDFKKQETGGVLLSDDARKQVLVAYQKRKQEEIEHPFLEEKTQWGLLFHIQALLLARHIRGDLDGYPPFLWR